jgi:hypothetical protein
MGDSDAYSRKVIDPERFLAKQNQGAFFLLSSYFSEAQSVVIKLRYVISNTVITPMMDGRKNESILVSKD